MGVHAGLVDLATFNLMNLQLASPAGGGDWLLVHLAVDYVTHRDRARRRAHLLPAPRRRRGREPGRPGAPDGDVLRGPPRRAEASDVSWSPAPATGPKAPPAPRACAARSSSGWAHASKPWTRARSRRSPIASARRRNCWTTWRRLSGFSCGSRRHEPANESGDAAVLQRARRAGGHPRAGRCWSLAATVFNVWQLVVADEPGSQRSAAESAAADARAQTLRQQTAQARSGLDGERLAEVAAAVREANAAIDGRTFSWTAVFNWLETSLPPDVRIASITPRVDVGRPLRPRVHGRRRERRRDRHAS